MALWYGVEGTFEVTTSRVDQFLCGLSVLGCYYGDVRITVGERIHQTRYYDRFLTENVDSWSATFEELVSVPSGRLVNTLRMRRVDQLTGPQTRPDFTRMDQGLDEYYTGDDELYEVSRRWVRHRYNLEAGEADLHLWSDENEQWTRVNPAERDQLPRGFVIGTSLIYAADGYYSRDVGLTFERAPAISELPIEFEEHQTVTLNREVISLLRSRGEDDEVSNEIWGLNPGQSQSHDERSESILKTFSR